mgnify:CR=1 FL=1
MSQDMQIEQTEVLIHTHSNIPSSLFDDNDYSKFGIINIKMKPMSITKQPTFILFTIDRTGSMLEQDKNGITRIQQVKETLKNCIRYLAKQDIEFYICIHAFNDTVETIINNTLINANTDLSDIINVINNIECDGLTNMGEALLSGIVKMDLYALHNPTHQISHIFMADGNPTTGNVDDSQLSNMVCEKYYNVFIGYGKDHNVCLLRDLCKNKNSNYLFVDKLENTSLVYGEAIHKILYPALKNIEIIIEDGYIYDWKTNEWTNVITEGVFIGEETKTYNIKTTNEDNVSVAIYADYGDCFEMNGLIDTMNKIPALITPDGSLIDNVNNLTHHIYRQMVMELLFKAKANLNAVQKIDLKTKIRELFDKMIYYNKFEQHDASQMIKTLLSDLSIVYNALDCNNLSPFVMSRYSSQGGQNSYNTTFDNDDHDEILMNDISPPILRRSSNYIDHDSDDSDDYDRINTYISSTAPTTPYATPAMLNTMSQISQM